MTLLVFGGIALANAINDTLEAMGDQPLTFGDEEPPLTGPPGATVPSQPESCPEICFSDADIGSTIPTRTEFTAFGTPEEVASWARSQYSSVRSEYSFTARTWVDLGGGPDECFPVYIAIPVAAAFDEPPDGGTDRIDFIANWTDATGYTYISLATRVFSDASAASSHLADVNRLVGACSHYTIGSGVDTWSADVSLAPALELPPTTAAAGWVEQGSLGRYYVFDVQRSNLVVRMTVSAVGTVSERQVREFAQRLAERLAAIEPVAP